MSKKLKVINFTPLALNKHISVSFLVEQENDKIHGKMSPLGTNLEASQTV